MFDFDRITIEPAKCGGNPCVRGMRITVRRVLDIIATYDTREELFNDYPCLEEEDLVQAVAYAKKYKEMFEVSGSRMSLQP